MCTTTNHRRCSRVAHKRFIPSILHFSSLMKMQEESIFKELRRMIPKVGSNLTDIAAVEARFGRVLMEHAQPRQLMNSKICKRWVLTFELRATRNEPFSGSILAYEQGPWPHPHFLDSTKFVLKLKKYCFWNLYPPQVIYIRHYNSKTCKIFGCFKTSNRSLLYWMVRHAMLFYSSQKNYC